MQFDAKIANMTLRHIIFFTAFMAIGLTAYASPAKVRDITLTQPNGYTFEAILRGDEFHKILKTKDGGYSVTRDPDGWWCYAYYDADGSRHSSGARIGIPASPVIMEASRQIPYSVIVHNALEKRSIMQYHEEKPVLKKIMEKKQSGIATKAGSPASKHGIAILAQYKDIKFKYTREDFDKLLNSTGYKGTGCAMDYFNDQFHGQVEFTFDVSDIITLPDNRAYYGGNDSEGSDKHPGEMVYEACRLADSSVDFSKYDDDGDGEVDNVFVFFAGEDEADGADEDCIWSHAWYLAAASYYNDGKGIYTTGDGVKINRYACTSELSRIYTTANRYTTELAGIGTFCHEYSHTLGLPDLYDTDYEENGEAAGLWHWTALMDGGNMNSNGNIPPYYNCIDREMTGISEPEMITSGTYTLEPIHKSGRYLKIPTDNSKEYFLVECRSNDNWDKYIGYSANAGSGLLVYHIDRTSSRIWDENTVNADASHQYADLIEADCRPDRMDLMSNNEYSRYLYDVRGIFFPQGNTVLSSSTHPAFRTWSGNDLPYSLTDITLNADGSVSFSVATEKEIIPQATDILSDTFPDAAIIQWTASYNMTSTAYVRYGVKGSDATTDAEVKPYSENRYSLTLKDLKPQTAYSIEIYYKSESGDAGEVLSYAFLTQRAPSVSYPYIHIGKAEFTAGDRLPLHVVNASGAASVTWELDGKGISVSGDGYHYPETPGTHILKATVNYNGGARDIMTRQITVK